MHESLSKYCYLAAVTYTADTLQSMTTKMQYNGHQKSLNFKAFSF